MSPSVGTKSKKKQPASYNNNASETHGDTVGSENRELEQSLLHLEDACTRILMEVQANTSNDTESRYWHQKFENIATPVSLALAECKGPRKFHYHYRRREDDETVLHPVMEDPLATLAKVCEEALHHCQDDMQGMHETDIGKLRSGFEAALRHFLASHKQEISV